MTLEKSILEISDGNVTFNLLDLNPIGWGEVIPDWKNGGVWQSSPFNDGEVLSVRLFSNTNDVFGFSPKEPDQNLLIAKLRSLISLLEKAVSFGTNEWSVEPVWIKVQGQCEDNPIYAIIRGYKVPGMDDPTFEPFAKGTLEGWALALTHDMWQSEQPQTATCVEVSGSQTYHDARGAADSVSTLTQESTVQYFSGQRESLLPSTTGARSRFGVWQNVSYFNVCSAIKFYLTVPRRSQIQAACQLDLVAFDNVAAVNVEVRVTAERGAPTTLPIVGVTGLELVNRPRLAPYRDITINAAWIALTTYSFVGLTAIIQAVIDQPEWEGEGWVTLYIENRSITTAGRYRSFCTDNTAGGNYPILRFDYYSENVIRGIEAIGATCENDNIVADKHNHAQIDQVWFWDASVAGGTGHNILPTDEANFPGAVQLHNATPAIGDMFYFGCEIVGALDEGPFDNLVLYMYDTPEQPLTGVWEFYDGNTAGWLAFAANTWYDGTNGFFNPGLCVVSWIPSVSPDWMSAVDPDGAGAMPNGWWVRFRITGVPAGIAVQAISVLYRWPYTCCWPYVDLSDDAVPGDIAALAKSFLWPRSMDDDMTDHYPYNSFYLAVRSLSRGADFSPYINLSDTQNPIGVNTDMGVGGTVLTADDGTTPWGAPTGAWALHTPAGVGWVDSAGVTFSYNVARQYRGKFAVWLRCVQIDGVAHPNYYVRAKLSYRFGRQWQETDPVIIYQYDGTADYENYFMGYLDFGPDLASDEFIDKAEIRIWLDNSDAMNTPKTWLMDLVVMPVDEFAVFCDTGGWDPDESAWPYNTDYAEVDSLELRKTGGTRSFLIRKTIVAAGNLPGIAKTVAAYTEGPWRLPNNSQARVWYFALHNPHLIASEQHFMNSRYLFSRGSS